MSLSAGRGLTYTRDLFSLESEEAPLSWLARFLSRRTLLADRFAWVSVEALGPTAREVDFASSGGATLGGWLIEGRRPGTIVFCSGNSGNLSAHVEYLRMAVDTGFSVLGFDYRGYGRSSGIPDLRFLVDDVLSACRFARDRSSEAEPIGLFGISLGAASTLAAAAATAEDFPIAGVAVEGLSDLYEMLAGLFAGGRFGPVRIDRVESPGGESWARERVRLGAGPLPGILARALAWRSCRSYPFAGKRPVLLADALEKTPVFVIHGVDDELLPMEAAIDVYESLGGEKSLWLIPHAGHAQEPAMSHRAEYVTQLDRFFARAFSAEAGDDVAGFSVRRELVTEIVGSTIRQRVVNSNDSTHASATYRIPVATLAEDGFPETGFPEAVHDDRSRAYREDGYRELFRRLVRCVNARDFDGLDRGLEEYLRLPRAMPFDFLASMYAFRIAQASRGDLRGWPTPSEVMAQRAVSCFETLWDAHDELRANDSPESPRALLGELSEGAVR